MTSLVATMTAGVVSPDDAVLTADDFGLTRGDGCFDATRVVVSEGEVRVDHLERHLDRFQASARGMDLPWDREAWCALIDQAVSAWDIPGEATLKLLLTRGREDHDTPTGIVMIQPFTETAPRAGCAVITLNRGYHAQAFVDAPWLLGGVKTTSYAVNMAAKREAARRGAHDALFVSSDGFALEGPNAALLWLRDGVLRTTHHDGTGVLRSITQAVAFEGAQAENVETRYELAPIDEIFSAEGAWLLSSIRGVAPIHTLDGRELRRHEEFTRRLNQWTGFH